jgi:hypothetical protein
MITEAKAKAKYLATSKKLEKFYGKKLDALEKERDEKTDRIYDEYALFLEGVEDEEGREDEAAYEEYMKVVDHYRKINDAAWAEKQKKEATKKVKGKK